MTITSSQEAAEILTTHVTCQVAFNSGGQTYTYKVPSHLSPKELDLVVVEVGARGPTVGRVTSVGGLETLDPHAKFEYKWIVDIVDRAGYDRILEAQAFIKGPQTLKVVDGEVVSG